MAEGFFNIVLLFLFIGVPLLRKILQSAGTVDKIKSSAVKYKKTALFDSITEKLEALSLEGEEPVSHTNVVEKDIYSEPLSDEVTGDVPVALEAETIEVEEDSFRVAELTSRGKTKRCSQKKNITLRDAILWKEILDKPISLREER